MRWDPAIMTALVVLALAAAVAGWLLSDPWIVHRAVHWEAPVSVSTATTAARR